MLRLVILSPGMTGRAWELKADKSTIGRVEDNTFPHRRTVEFPVTTARFYCAAARSWSATSIRPTARYINREKVTEGVLKPGQILRLGQVEMRLEADSPTAPGKYSSTAPP